MSDAKKGDLVEVNKIVLGAEERPDTLPDETRSVPYEVWIKGFLLKEEANLGEEVEIETFIGRTISGTLTRVGPIYDHNFGKPQIEMLTIGKEARNR